MRNLFLTFLISSVLLTPLCSKLSTIVHSSSVATTTEYHNDYNSQYKNVFNKMKKGMNAKPCLDNVNFAFVTEMIPHHEGAIGMSNAIVKYGCNAEVKSIAEHIIQSQNTQLPLMESMKFKFEKESKSDCTEWSNYITAYDKIKDKMFKSMESVKPSDNADVTFLKQMIPHHEGAIEMSKEILKYTKDPQLKKLAEDIVNSQNSGVQKMKDLLKTLDK